MQQCGGRSGADQDCFGWPLAATAASTVVAISPHARRLVMMLWRQGLAFGLRPQHPQDLLQCHNAWTEGIPIVLGDVTQLADQRFGLCVVQFKVHIPEMGSLTSICPQAPTIASHGLVIICGSRSTGRAPGFSSRVKQACKLAKRCVRASLRSRSANRRQIAIEARASNGASIWLNQLKSRFAS